MGVLLLRAVEVGMGDRLGERDRRGRAGRAGGRRRGLWGAGVSLREEEGDDGTYEGLDHRLALGMVVGRL